MTTRYYSSTAVQTTGTAGINGVQTTMSVLSTSGWPVQYPFLLILNENQVDEELVDVTNVSGLTVTMTRGVDGTSAQSHTIGFTVKHGFSGRDFRDSRTHEGSGSGVHGLSGNLVDDSTAQVLSNKTLASPLVTGTFPVHAHTGGSDGGTLASVTAHIAATAAHGATGAVVGTTNVQSLSNKTLLGAVANPVNVNSKGLLVKGLASQSDNISEVQLNDGTPVLYVDALGRTNVGSAVMLQAASGAPSVLARAQDAASIPVVARGKDSQTSNLIEAQDSSGTAVATISPTGAVLATGLTVQTALATTQAGLLAKSPGSTSVAATVQGATSQTANLQEWKNVGGTVLASVDTTGRVISNGQPYAMAADNIQFAFGGGNTLSIGVAFPSRFTQVPIVTVAIANSPAGSRPVTCRVSGLSSAGATITVNSVDSSAMSGTWAVCYIAVQMTATSASG